MKTKNFFSSTSSILNKVETPRTLSRRSFMQLSALGVGGLFLGSCTENPPNPSPISWQPYALTPVFYGLREYGTADGAPGKCRVFFPSLDGSPDSAAILPGRRPYPLILLAHGQCNEIDHYKKWFHLPAQLARCGYVVVVPEMTGINSGYPSDPNHPSLTRMQEMVTWIRTGWTHKNLVRPSYMGVIGHSYGALLGARFATSNDVTAYISLAGRWHDWSSGPLPFIGFSKPVFLVWGSSDSTSIVDNNTWNAVAKSKHKAIFQNGLHWDYLRPGTTSCENSTGRGPCAITPALTGDLVSMFFAKYLIPQDAAWQSVQIPDSLIPPLPLQLTFEQEFYAGSHLNGFPQLAGNTACSLSLSWDTYGGSGSVQKP